MSILHLRGRMTSDKHKLAQMAESLRVTHTPVKPPCPVSWAGWENFIGESTPLKSLSAGEGSRSWSIDDGPLDSRPLHTDL